MGASRVKGYAVAVISFCLLGVISLPAQPRPQAGPAQPPERYKMVLDRLDSMTAMPVSQWRYHTADIPHPEDPSLDDSTWAPVNLGRNAGNQPGSANTPGWYRTWVEMPSTVGGKEIRGSRVH